MARGGRSGQEGEEPHTQTQGHMPAALISYQLWLSEERITAAGGQNASLSEGSRVVPHLHPQSPLSRQKQSPCTPLD